MKQTQIKFKDSLLIIYKRILNLVLISAILALPIGSYMAYDTYQYNERKYSKEIAETKIKYDNEKVARYKENYLKAMKLQEQLKTSSAYSRLEYTLIAFFGGLLGLIIHSYIFFGKIILWHRAT